MALQQADSLRAILDTVFQSSVYDWVPDRDPWAWLRRAWAALLLWLGELQQANPVGFRVLAYVAILVLLLVVGQAVRVFIRTIRTEPRGPDDPALPDAPRRDAEWFRREARQHAAAGRYPEAVEADFRALLLTLESRAVLRIQPSMTPAEYARNVRLPPAARDDFEESVRRLYGYLFARWPCGPDEYAAWKHVSDPDRYAPAR